MIIFDLDGTLADCEHRRHFVDGSKNSDYFNEVHSVEIIQAFECDEDFPKPRYKHKTTGNSFKADWKSFYEACDKDQKGRAMSLFDFIGMNGQAHNLQIWSGRCESVREKTISWLKNYSFAFACHQFDIELKMRPIGDYTPDDQLKERWLLEYIYESNRENNNPNPIEFVFDDRPKVIRMWRKYGIFVFNCCQHDEEF